MNSFSLITQPLQQDELWTIPKIKMIAMCTIIDRDQIIKGDDYLSICGGMTTQDMKKRHTLGYLRLMRLCKKDKDFIYVKAQRICNSCDEFSESTVCCSNKFYCDNCINGITDETMTGYLFHNELLCDNVVRMGVINGIININNTKDLTMYYIKDDNVFYFKSAKRYCNNPTHQNNITYKHIIAEYFVDISEWCGECGNHHIYETMITEIVCTPITTTEFNHEMNITCGPYHYFLIKLLFYGMVYSNIKSNIESGGYIDIAEHVLSIFISTF